MGITNSNKELSQTQIPCGGEFKIKLSVAAEPDIVTNPADIVLVLDRSGSMAGSPLASLKDGAKEFINIIDEATDGAQDGHIGFGSRIGIVSFSGTGTVDVPLTSSVSELKAAVDALSAGGTTNHSDAFTKALGLFGPVSANAKIIVMFTDGRTTAGGDPNIPTAAAKAMGAEIYVIGLSGNGGIDEPALRQWASDPDSAFVAITPDDSELEELFEDLARNITNPGATNIVITDKVLPCFAIGEVTALTKGTATVLDANTLRWTICELGVTAGEGAELEFTVRHIGPCSGETEVNEYTAYSDAEGNAVTFPSPEITVDCGIVVMPEGCPEPVDIEVDGCGGTVVFDAGDVFMESLGRVLQLDVTVKRVCPNRRVALAAIITEVDGDGNEHDRGFKTVTVPAHTMPGCRDVTVRCIKFVLPEDISASEEPGNNCKSRKFRARFIANYIDGGFECCQIPIQ